MYLEINTLYSGSNGNCSYIKKDNKLLLLDAGVSFNKIAASLKLYDIKKENITSVIITHEHNDHTAGLEKIFKHLDCNIYMTKKTFYALKNHKNLDLKKIIFYEDNFFIDDFQVHIKTYKSFHDCEDGRLFSFNFLNNIKIAYICDTGKIPDAYCDLLKDHNIYMIESNHEPSLLFRTFYPYHVQHRIFSDKGHLSNEECLIFLRKVITNNTKNIIFLHVSENSNNLNLLNNKIINFLKEIHREDINFKIAKKDNYKDKKFLIRIV